MKISVVIAAEDPDVKTEEYIKSLIENKIEDIIIVDKGCAGKAKKILERLKSLPVVTIIESRKSARDSALKAAFKFLSENRPETDAAVCCAEDGRYSFAAIKECVRTFAENPKSVILGKRAVSDEKLSLKTKIGSSISGFLYRFALGIKLKDTGCSLRLIPSEYFGFFASLEGSEAGYETRMLSGIVNEKIPYEEALVEAPVKSPSLERGFRSLKKTIAVYSIVLAYFIKFALSSVSSYLLDLGLYALVLYFVQGKLSVGAQVLVCTAVSRVISSLFNYTLNRKTVFKSTDNLAATTLRYYILAVLKLAASYALIYLFTDLLGITGFAQLIIKAVVDLVLFVFSFQFQRVWVFKNKKA